MGRMDALGDQAATALAQTSGFSAEERQAIMTLIREQAIWSHAVENPFSSVLREMGARDFEWPEFDRWHTIFSRRGVFPPSWQGLERRPFRDASFPTWQAYQERKFYLLLDWLHGLIATRAQMRAALARYALRGLRAVIARQSADIKCPACDVLSHEHVRRSSNDVPPFHPGCRCLILATQQTRD